MITVVGIGDDGWDGLGEPARTAIARAETIIGGDRHLALIPPDATGADRRPWPSPMAPALDELAATTVPVVVLASGDPMLHGVGASLARRAGPGRLRVIPAVSAWSLACARLGWPLADTELISLVGRPVEHVLPALAPERRLVVYVADADGAGAVSALLRDHGWGPTELTILERLGGPGERVTATTAQEHRGGGAPLQTLALRCRPERGVRALGRTPGLPDEAFDHDGQLTKREARALTLAALAPLPGELLWDVGAGSGSVSIEWLRTHPSMRAVAIEPRADRAARVRRNARDLGVPHLDVREGRAPAALAGLPAPDAVFLGGGLTADGVLDACLAAIRPGGRLVATAVTVETEQLLVAAHAAHGGRLTRLAVSRAEPLGGFTAWRPQMPLTQWTLERPRP